MMSRHSCFVLRASCVAFCVAMALPVLAISTPPASAYVQDGLIVWPDGYRYNAEKGRVELVLPPGIVIQGEDDLGSPDPAVGKYDLEDGESLPCRAIAATNATTLVRGRASGYTLETFDAASGTWGEPVAYDGDSYVHRQSGTALTRLTWRWVHETRLKVTCAAADGSVTMDGKTGTDLEYWGVDGAAVDVTATPKDETIGFVRWNDDVGMDGRWDATRTVTLDGKTHELSPVFMPFGHVETLVSAVKNVAEGATIVIQPGLYRLDSELHVTKANVTLRGATGNPADVVLDGQGARRCVCIDWGGGVLCNVTCINGAPSGANGGGAYLKTTTENYCTVSNCVFENCRTLNMQGGGVYAWNTSVSDCDFYGCVADNHGGSAVYFNSPNADLTGCRFYGNRQLNGNYLDGGTVQFVPYGRAVRNCVFVGNQGKYGTVYGKPSLVVDCAFTNNFTYKGGVAYLYRDNVPATTSLFSRCTMHGNGTSFSLFSSRSSEAIRFDHCTLTTNYLDMTQSGYLIYHADTGSAENVLSISNCIFRKHSSMVSTAGYGFFQTGCRNVYGSTFEDCAFKAQSACLINVGHNGRVENCRFVRGRFATSSLGGSAVQVSGTNVAIRSCLFVSNYVNQARGPAVYIDPDSANWATIDNCTFAYNHQNQTGFAGSYGGTVCISANTIVRNSLFYRNHCGLGRPVFFDYSTYAAYAANFHNCWEHDNKTQLKDSPGCTVDNVTDLKFVDPDPYASCNFEIARSSPLVDKGVDLDWIGKRTLDVRNDRHYKRLYGEHPDIGAYEFGRLPGLLMFVK